ncbi:MAG: methyltransferase domain-containing protein [Vicinamibacterales bacterium]
MHGSEHRLESTRLIVLPPARPRPTRLQRAVLGARGALGVVPFALLAHASGLPGLEVRLRIAALAARIALGRGRVRSTAFYNMLCFPMDSTRYFEFDFMWRRLQGLPGGRYLDVSSPRLLPMLFVDANPELRATLVNPDPSDLAETFDLAEVCGLDSRCTFESTLIEALAIPDGSLDVITSISVLEHIRDDVGAVARMWQMLRPGGRLLLSLPCAATAEQQFLNVKTYDFTANEDDGSAFHQYLYSEATLRRLLAVTGPPAVQEVYGERVAGFHLALYERKWRDRAYPFWREPWFMTGFSRFASIQELPGEGVVLLEFVK